MNEAEAREALKLELQAGSPPVLIDAEISHLLWHMATIDESGNVPTDDDWEPTYDRRMLSYAAMRGWLFKAGKVAGMVTYSADGARFDAGALQQQCRDQANEIRKRLVVSVAARPANEPLETATA